MKLNYIFNFLGTNIIEIENTELTEEKENHYNVHKIPNREINNLAGNLLFDVKRK